MKKVTLNIGGTSFEVRSSFRTVLQRLHKQRPQAGWGNIQVLLCRMFSLQQEWLSSEYAAAVALYFPESNIPANAVRRAVADVRKYNKAAFACQKNVVPAKPVRLLDGGAKSRREVAPDVDDVLRQLGDEEAE